MSFPKSKYKIFKSKDNKVIAVSTYAGKTVKGVSKCDPRDSFDQTFGEDLAIARCSHKIAKKRAKRAKAEQAKAIKSVDAAMRKMQKMNKYVMDAESEVHTTADAINDLMKNA